jgi:integrase
MAKRRRNHEGSIIKRPNGKYQAFVSIQRIRIGKTFSTCVECQKWIREMEIQNEEGLSFIESQISLTDYLADWLLWAKSSLRPNTLHQYRGNISNHIRPAIGEIRLFDLKPVHLERLYAQRAKSGVGARTIQISHTVLNKALKRAMRLGFITSNPAEYAQKPKYRRAKMTVLNDHQVRSLLIASKGIRIEPLVYLAATSGMRQGELLGLKWGDIHWEQESIRIQRQLQRIKGNGGLKLTSPKTRRSNRTINIGEAIVGKLSEHRESQWVLDEATAKAESLVFPNSKGNPLEPRRVYTEFKNLLAQTGLPDIRFHELRHTAASLMLSNGTPIVEVSNQLGHSKVSTTLDIYGHLIPGLKSQAVDALEDLVIPIAAELQQRDTSVSDKAAVHE